MLFPTFTFFAFFAVVLGLNWWFKRWPIVWRVFLLLTSYFFYATWDTHFVAILVVLTVVTYLLAFQIKNTQTSRRKLLFLVIAIIANVVALFLFKYYDFFRVSLEGLFTLLHARAALPALSFVLPIGLSFYVLRNLSFVIDTFRGTLDRFPSLLDFSIYISFFPQLLSGPIARPGQFLPQLVNGGARTIDRFHEYFGRIALGLFKKLVIASYFSAMVTDKVFSIPQYYGSLEILIAIYAYAIVIYCDFSGYSDMAIGIAGLLGFTSPENFRSPYGATSLQEFWRRWHISFSEWLRDYIYIPLGGSRTGNGRTVFNILTTMLVSGLWHGAGLNYLLWGAIHGIGLVVERFMRQSKARVVGWLITFHIVAFAWVVFRSPRLSDAFAVFSQLFSGMHLGIITGGMVVVLVGTFAMIVYEQKILDAYSSVQSRLPLGLQIIVLSLLIILIIEKSPGVVPSFIYFGF